MIHLSYHDGEHYNSVREASDFGRGPPRELSLGTRTASGADAAQLRQSWGVKEVQLVKQGTGCDDTGPVEWALNSSEGQVDEVRLCSMIRKAPLSPFHRRKSTAMHFVGVPERQTLLCRCQPSCKSLE